MTSPKRFYSLAERGLAAVFLVVIMHMVAIPARAQETCRCKPDDEKAQELMLLQKKTHTFEDVLNRDPDAIANEMQLFCLTSDPELKQRLASILMSIGVKDKIYFDYLTDAAKKALNNDMPWPTLYDEHGDIIEKGASPAFLEWCRKHGVSPNEARSYAYYEIPNPWYYLAAAGDPRAYDLLIEGLHSHNLMIAGTAAQGLAKLQDPRAIPELIATGRGVPGEARFASGQALLYFSDPRAQAAANELITDKNLLERERHEAQTKGVKGLFHYH